MKFIIMVCCLFALTLSCNQARRDDVEQRRMDSLRTANGEKVFVSLCSGCHNFRTDGIGPRLDGITASVDDEWIKKFIRNPKPFVDSVNSREQGVFQKFQAMMPSFSLPDSQANDLVLYLHTQKPRISRGPSNKMTAIEDPVPDTVAKSNLRFTLHPIIQMPPSSRERPLTRINKIQQMGGVMYVLDMRGKLYALKNKTPRVYFDLAANEPHFLEKPGLGTGFGSFAFHPAFGANGLLYTTHTEPSRSARADFAIPDSIRTALQWVLTEWKLSKPGDTVFSGTHRELMRVDMVSAIHGMQEISFRTGAGRSDNDYGLLYIGIGDGGSVENGYPFLAHHTDKPWGAILRIDPLGHNSANGKYGIPAGNVLSAGKAQLGELYAYGFRNPNRISWSRSGLMLVTNIGQANIESLEVVRMGNDFGWPLREGPFLIDAGTDMKNVYPLPADDSINHFTYPALLYDHDEGRAISGGFEYTGHRISALTGKYVFGDIPSGRLFVADVKRLTTGHPAPIKEFSIRLNDKNTTLRQLCGDQRVDLRFGKDASGEIYILTKFDGMIYRLE